MGRLCLAIAALAVVASPADARPKRKDARTAFDRGLAAYRKGNYTAASESLRKSYQLEKDVETTFALAQAERKLDHCDKAIDLYEELLTLDLTPANKEAVNGQLTECKEQIAAEHKAEPPGTEPVAPANPPPGASSPPPGSPSSAPRDSDTSTVVERPAPTEPPVAGPEPHGRPWYKNPIVLGLTGSGLVAMGVGGWFLLSAQSADNDFKTATNYGDANSLLDKAKSHGQIGQITVGIGGALVVGGVVWAIVSRGSSEQHAMSAWLAPGGGGLAVSGAF